MRAYALRVMGLVVLLGGCNASARAAAGGGKGAQGRGPMVAGCRVFPPDNPWNRDVSRDPVRANSAALLAKMTASKALHADWGTVSERYGIPFTAGTGAPPQPITWTAEWGATESDPRPCPTGGHRFCYPIPLTAPIEGGPQAEPGSDRHILYVDTAGAPDACTLFELYNVQNPTGRSGFKAANGAIFSLGSNALRPDGWTSADAAGLPILPGLVRLDEVQAGEIRHALRFTLKKTSKKYIHPATHAAGRADDSLPPMGLRLRLKAGFDAVAFSSSAQVVLTAMKRYGIILADNGGDWFVSGESNEGWGTIIDRLRSDLARVHGTDFEVIDTGPPVH